MTYNGHAKVQHYVPQFLLKNFGKGKKNLVFVYDKKGNKEYKTNIKNIASETKFYDFKTILDGVEVIGSIEEKLAEIEGNANTALKKILDADSISVISDEEKMDLSLFLAAQVARTKNSRINYELLPELFTSAIQQRGLLTKDLQCELDEFNKNKDLFFAMHVAQQSEQMASLFYNKIWILGKNDTKMPFCIGDDPVVCYNDFSKGIDPMINPHSFGVVGAMTYLPITPKRVLHLFCPVKAKEVIRELSVIEPLFLHKSFFLDVYTKIDNCQQLYNALVNNEALSLKESHIKHINSLEILGAERYVVSSSNDFRFTEMVLKENSSFQYHGKRIEVL